MDEETKEVMTFVLEAIEKLSLGMLTDKYDFDEMQEIYEQTLHHLYSLK